MIDGFNGWVTDLNDLLIDWLIFVVDWFIGGLMQNGWTDYGMDGWMDKRVGWMCMVVNMDWLGRWLLTELNDWLDWLTDGRKNGRTDRPMNGCGMGGILQ